jgi:hypothetical protein
MAITLESALKLKFDNEYQIKNLLKAKELLDHINTFHKCECYVTTSNRSDGIYWLEYMKFVLDNEIIGVVIRYDEYRKKYSFYGDWDSRQFENLSTYQMSDIRKQFTEPRGVGKLNKKKIAEWIKYEEDIYLESKKKNLELNDKVSDFLKTLVGQNINWHKNKPEEGVYNGEIIKNGIKYSFNIADGCINQKVEIYYQVPNSLESFLLLSDNKINRKNKIERILKNS